MKITIQNIAIQNFKGFVSYQTVLNPDITSFYGENGTGKTSLADAISWCLFGKDTENRQQFDIKHHAPDGSTEKGIEVSVSLDILCDSVPHNITRKLKENWVKQRGTTNEVFKGNATEYFVDSQPYTQAEFKSFISQIINESTFRAITSPTFFCSQKWEEQRRFLSNMVGEISNTEIAGGDEKYSKLLESLSTETIISVLKSLRYRINECKSKLSEYPVSIAALKKTLPEIQESPTPLSEEEIRAEIFSINNNISNLKKGNTSEVQREEINSKINFAQKRINEMERSATNMAARYRDEAFKKSEEKRNRISEIELKISKGKGLIEENKIEMDRANKQLEICKQDMDALKVKWEEKVNAPANVQISEEDKLCPTCGQELPQESIQQLILERREKLMKQRAKDEEELTSQINDVKELRNQCKKILSINPEAIKIVEGKIKSLTSEIEELEAKKAETPKTYDEILADNPNYKAVKEEITTLKSQLENISDTPIDEEQLEKYTSRLSELENLRDSIQKNKVIQEQRDKIELLISQAQSEQKSCAERLAALEREEDIARSFSDRADSLLEQKVNKHFSLVKWRMFRQNINGNKEPYCECYVNNTAYHDGLNSAMKINAGLDIINTLCKIYNCNAPITIDNNESVNDIIPTQSQQIRLYVSKDTSLIIK